VRSFSGRVSRIPREETRENCGGIKKQDSVPGFLVDETGFTRIPRFFKLRLRGAFRENLAQLVH
jgi:hypothetical protein